jgi:TPR repeat protein
LQALDPAGVALHDRDFVEAHELMLMAAKQGDHEAQNNLGVMYADSLGVARDEEKVVYWYQQSALQGSEAGQYNLGHAYARGIGVPQDIGKAVNLYQKAARGGDMGAHNNLVVRMTSDELQ